MHTINIDLENYTLHTRYYVRVHTWKFVTEAHSIIPLGISSYTVQNIILLKKDMCCSNVLP